MRIGRHFCRFSQLTGFVLVLAAQLTTQAPGPLAIFDAECIRWSQHNKFGMFIQWGAYSYLAGEWKSQQVPVGIEAEWIMQRFNIRTGPGRTASVDPAPVVTGSDTPIYLNYATAVIPGKR